MNESFGLRFEEIRDGLLGRADARTSPAHNDIAEEDPLLVAFAAVGCVTNHLRDGRGRELLVDECFQVNVAGALPMVGFGGHYLFDAFRAASDNPDGFVRIVLIFFFGSFRELSDGTEYRSFGRLE